MKTNMKKILMLLLGLLLTAQMLSVFTFADSDDFTTLSPASTQQRRMWCNTTYDSGDWIYEPWNVTYWARVNYVRFASNDVSAAKIKKATLKLDARARASEKTVYLAALAIPDDAALRVETDLTSLTSTNTIVSTDGTDAKLMLNRSGYYLSDVAKTVAAYTKATAGDTVTTNNTYTGSGDFVFNYPAEIELDVTQSVREAFTSGNHVQFVLTSAKDILTPNGENLHDMDGFTSYSNGVIYGENGEVLANTDDRLSLDTSIPVCGDAGYYTSSEINDEYFSWLYIVRDSITLEIEWQDEDAVFAEFKAGIGSASDLGSDIDAISYLLDEQSWTLYNKIRESGDINTLLYDALSESTSLAEFNTAFADIVYDEYWQGYELRVEIEREFGGKRGCMIVEGDTVPDVAYALIEVYDSEDSMIKSYITNVKNGTGYYNTYDVDGAAQINITLTSNSEGKQPISGTQTVKIEKTDMPSVFITELSNEHVMTYYPDNGEHNYGTNEQTFQYIELYNYSDETAYLNEYTFVYNDGSEHEFDWIAETECDMQLNPGELFMIGVYSADSASKGYTYENDTELAEYWEGFNAFYDVDIPVSNRVMIACVASGDGSSMLDGMDHLERSYDAGVTVSAEMRKNGETVTKVSLPDNKPKNGYAYQFVPLEGETEESFLFCTGCFPYKLLDEQDPAYCKEVYFNSADEIKVMSYNVLATDNAGLTVASRFPLFVRTLENYDVGIVGMQEVNYIWAELLENNMPSEYSCVEGLSADGHDYSSASGIWDLLNPIYYRNDKYTLIDSGAQFLTPDGNQNSAQWDSVNMKRTMTWAVLEDNNTGETVTFINTHLVLSGKTARVEQVKMLYNKGAELQKKYGGGIVIVGDHNMQEGSEPYLAYLDGGVVVDSKYQTTNHNSVSTCTSFSGTSEIYGTPIDFCFISPNKYIVQKYEVFDGVYSDGTVSDHSAVYVELLDRDLMISDEPEAEPEEYVVGDVNADGAVTPSDGVIISRYLAGWSGYDILPYSG